MGLLSSDGELGVLGWFRQCLPVASFVRAPSDAPSNVTVDALWHRTTDREHAMGATHRWGGRHAQWGIGAQGHHRRAHVTEHRAVRQGRRLPAQPRRHRPGVRAPVSLPTSPLPFLLYIHTLSCLLSFFFFSFSFPSFFLLFLRQGGERGGAGGRGEDRAGLEGNESKGQLRAACFSCQVHIGIPRDSEKRTGAPRPHF